MRRFEAGQVTPGYIALLEEVSEHASALYRQGWAGIPKLNGVAATAVGVAALNYEGILQKLRQNGFDNLTRRAYLRPVERLGAYPQGVLRRLRLLTRLNLTKLKTVAVNDNLDAPFDDFGAYDPDA